MDKCHEGRVKGRDCFTQGGLKGLSEEVRLKLGDERDSAGKRSYSSISSWLCHAMLHPSWFAFEVTKHFMSVSPHRLHSISSTWDSAHHEGGIQCSLIQWIVG